MASKENMYLVKYESSSKVIKVCDQSNLVECERSTFGLKDSETVKLQKYFTEWDDYVDLSDSEVDRIESHSKLRCILQPKSGHSESLCDTVSLPESTLSSSASVSSQEFGNWPNEFLLPQHKYSMILQRQLREEKTLTWANKHELLNIVVEIFNNTYYPNLGQLTLVSKCLVKTHPYLTEKIGSGFDGWLQCLRDKLKNARQNRDVSSVLLGSLTLSQRTKL